MKFYSDASDYAGVPEIESLVKGVDLADGQGKEITLKITTEMFTDHEFYTDANGLDLQFRKKDWRADFAPEPKGTAPINYYPVNAILGIQRKGGPAGAFPDLTALYLVNDRP